MSRAPAHLATAFSTGEPPTDPDEQLVRTLVDMYGGPLRTEMRERMIAGLVATVRAARSGAVLVTEDWLVQARQHPGWALRLWLGRRLGIFRTLAERTHGPR